LCLAGCQKPPPPPPVSKSPTPVTITQPQQLHTATLVQIKNDWNGYSDITPIVRHYKLKPTGGGLAGNGHFAVGGYGAYNIRQQYTKRITIPAPIAQQFFRQLGETKMQQSTHYQPIKNRSDDYPAITIQIVTPRQEVTFFSSSQGKNYVPWQIKTKQATYISNSATPAAALAILKPYIDHPGLEQVINKRRQPKSPQSPFPKPLNLVKSPQRLP
jgi:hypothetical protein